VISASCASNENSSLIFVYLPEERLRDEDDRLGLSILLWSIASVQRRRLCKIQGHHPLRPLLPLNTSSPPLQGDYSYGSRVS
jgi:hypothetical protein